MKRVNLALGSIFISQILPLLAKPELIIATKNIVIMMANAAIWLTQPPISGVEAKENKKRDKFSVLLILFFSIGSIIISVVDWAYFNNSPDSFNLIIVGLILIVSGITFRVWSIQVLGKFFTPTVQIKEDHILIKKGPYSVVRHPSYLGAFATIVGAAVFFQSYIAMAVAILGMGISYYFRMKLEEKSLVEVFGQEYINYKKKVRQIIPFLW